jgi:tetratricopeptide (TPR) repeat protein
MTTAAEFSSRDLNVLNLLFDSEAQPAKPISPDTKPAVRPRTLQPEEIEEINSAEYEAVRLAEQGSLKKAEELLTKIIAKYPTERGSLWNNRAQVRRLQEDIPGALADLAHVIKLLTPTNNMSPSAEDSKVLSQAHIHRATIYMLLAKKEVPGKTVDAEDSETLESYASQDFTAAGKYGSDLGRAMGVRTNPYAKMCGAIVQTALKKELDPGV